MSAADLRSIRRRFYLLLALRFVPTGLFVTVFVLLMLERGLSLAQIGLGTAAQGVVMLFLELPSGGLADALGRKPVLILASLVLDRRHEPAARGRHRAAAGRRVGAPGRVPSARQRSARGVVHRRLARRRSRRRHRARAVAAERRDLHVDRRSAPCSAGSSARPTGCSGVNPLVVPIGLGLVLQVVGLVAIITLMHEVRAGEGWAAARQSIAAVPDVVRGAVRLIRGQLAAHRARRRRAPVGLRHDRLRDVPAAAAGRGERRRGGGGPAARPGDHGGVGAVGGGRGVRPVAGAAIRVARSPAAPCGSCRAAPWWRWAWPPGRPASSSPTSPTTGPTARRRPCTTGWSTAPSRRAIAPRSCRPTRSRPRSAAPSAASSLGALADATSITTAMLVAGVVLAAAGPLYLVGRSTSSPARHRRPLDVPVA